MLLQASAVMSPSPGPSPRASPARLYVTTWCRTGRGQHMCPQHDSGASWPADPPKDLPQRLPKVVLDIVIVPVVLPEMVACPTLLRATDAQPGGATARLVAQVSK